MSNNHWKEVKGHPIEDWRYEVANDDTRMGYLEWVKARVEDAGGQLCDACGAPITEMAGDGYCGTCPTCADRVHLERDTRFVITVNAAQLRQMIRAGELFTRMQLGQLAHCLRDFLPRIEKGGGGEPFDEALRTVCNLLEGFMPEGVNGYTSSLGIMGQEPEEAQVVYDVMQLMAQEYVRFCEARGLHYPRWWKLSFLRVSVEPLAKVETTTHTKSSE